MSSSAAIAAVSAKTTAKKPWWNYSYDELLKELPVEKLDEKIFLGLLATGTDTKGMLTTTRFEQLERKLFKPRSPATNFQE